MKEGTGEYEYGFSDTPDNDNVPIVIVDSAAGLVTELNSAFPVGSDHDVVIWIASSYGIANGDQIRTATNRFAVTAVSMYQSEGINVALAKKDKR